MKMPASINLVILGLYLFPFGVKGLEYLGEKNLKGVTSGVLMLFKSKINRDSWDFDVYLLSPLSGKRT